MTKHSKLYSETMRELSLLDEDSLKLYQMRWGLIDVDEVIVNKVGFAVYNNIPPATPVAKNAMLQIMASYENSFDRKEWLTVLKVKLHKLLLMLIMTLKMVLRSLRIILKLNWMNYLEICNGFT